MYLLLFLSFIINVAFNNSFINPTLLDIESNTSSNTYLIISKSLVS